MTLAKLLLRLWSLRIWVAVGVVLACAAAIASMTMFRSVAYASASTQMLIDSPQSALGNAGTDLGGYIARASVFARLMTSPQSMQYIARASGVPARLIAATGPAELDGSASASSASQPAQAPAAPYKLAFLQNPAIPTIDVYAEAPTTSGAVALANGAVAGFAAYINQLDTNNAVPSFRRIDIRQLGTATGGTVDPGAKKSMAALTFIAVLAVWCAGMLFLGNLRRQIREQRMAEGARREVIGKASPAVYLADLPAPELELSNADGLGDDEDNPVGVRLKR